MWDARETRRSREKAEILGEFLSIVCITRQAVVACRARGEVGGGKSRRRGASPPPGSLDERELIVMSRCSQLLRSSSPVQYVA